ncbi:MAG: hypothetical protein J5737_07125 [Bacteroidales bacterium]|nr:hypothetical protein [Bacteroidales bacterium]
MKLLFIILQVALGIFSENPELAAGNLCGYFPQDTIVSEAPRGYKPFYISHIARHGSRFQSDGAVKYFQAVDTLESCARQGLLTADGLALMEDIRMFRDMSQGHYGELTGLGALEHRQICGRMVRHYPEVFSGGKRNRVEAFTTSSSRVMASMDAFLSELSERAPGLVVDTFKTNWGKDIRSQEVIGYMKSMTDDQKKESDQKGKQLLKTGRKLAKGRNDCHVFAERIFLEPEKVPSSTVKYLAKATHRTFKTGRVTEPGTMPGMGKYLTADELYSLWISSCIQWLKYLNLPGYTSPLLTTRGYGILDRIVKDADDAIMSKSSSAATLRFSHDTYLLPLMGAIGLEGTVIDCDEMEVLDHFQDFNFVCPACNVQLVFYRRGCSPVLVKFLLNEKETLIHGLAPRTGCFYDWNAVKQFWAASRGM